MGRVLLGCLLIVLLTLPIGAQAQANGRPGAEIVYRMQLGDSPWDISERYLLGIQYWRRIVRLNGFADSTRLPPGTPVRIPIDWLQREAIPLTVLNLFDQVEIIGIDGSRRAAAPGTALLAGERLVTSDTGSATLGVENGSRVLVRPSSEVAVTAASRPIEVPGAVAPDDESQASPVGVQLRLLRGAIEGAVRRLTPVGRFEIETPAAVAAVRGTRLRVSTDGAESIAAVTEGRVALGNRAGHVRLDADQGTLTRPGRAPEPPTPLLPAPDLGSLPHSIERLPIALRLPLMDGAIGWHTQVYRRPVPVLVSDPPTSKSGVLRARDVTDGQYTLWVRGIDRRGIEGQTAHLDVIVFTQPPPPLMIQPAPQARVSAGQPDFRWTESADSSKRRAVRLQVAQMPDFGAPLADETSPDAGTARPQADFAPGTYYWRIAAVDPDTKQGPWSDAQEFLRVLPAPDVGAPDVDGDRLTLRWPKQRDAVQYRVQIAQDVDFAKPTGNQTVSSEQLARERPEAGVYFVRVRGIAADGEAGAFSKPEKFTVEKPVSPWYFLWLLVPLLLAL